MTMVSTTVSIARATSRYSGRINRETIAVETVAAPMLAKLFPRSNVASNRSGASSHRISFCAVLLPCAARCRILYLLLARIAVSESEKNADSAKKTINGATKIVDIQGWVLGYWNLAAAFRHGFLD